MNEMFATRRYGLMIAYRPINSISALFRTTTGIIIYEKYIGMREGMCQRLLTATKKYG